MIQPKKFYIGCWYQSAYSYDVANNWSKVDELKKWADRGINLAITPNPGPSPACTHQEYMQYAAKNNISVLIKADPTNPALDMTTPGFLGWFIEDEPETWDKMNKNPDGSLKVDESVAKYKALYTSLKAINPNVPCFINFTTSLIWAGPTQWIKPEHFQGWMSAADWLCLDSYITNYSGLVTNFPAQTGHPIEVMKSWAPGKPYFSYVECSDFDSTNLGKAPTPQEMVFEVWANIVYGAKGIIYFSHRITENFTEDATPPELVAAMKKLHPDLMKLSDILVQDATPVVINGNFLSSHRTFKGVNYKFILNNSTQSATFEGLHYDPLSIRITGRNNKEVYYFNNSGTVTPVPRTLKDIVVTGADNISGSFKTTTPKGDVKSISAVYDNGTKVDFKPA